MGASANIVNFDDTRKQWSNFQCKTSGGDETQLVQHRTCTPLTLVQFTDAAKDFFPPEPTFIADSFTVSAQSRVQSHALTSVRTLKIP